MYVGDSMGKRGDELTLLLPKLDKYLSLFDDDFAEPELSGAHASSSSTPSGPDRRTLCRCQRQTRCRQRPTPAMR